MKFAIFGAGGVGGYFGAKLAAAGNDVSIIARGAHLKAIRERGLRVESAGGSLLLKPALATDDPAAAGAVDCVLLCVKLWDLESAAKACAPMVATGGYVVPIQNGIEAIAIASAMLGAGKVVGGIAYIAAAITEPGMVKHTGAMARLAFGEADGLVSPRVEQLVTTCRAAGIDVELADNINVAQWRKFVFLASVSGWTALTRQPMGVLARDPDIRAGLRNAIAEAVAVARAGGAAVRRWAMTRSTPRSRPSTGCRPRCARRCSTIWSTATGWSCRGYRAPCLAWAAPPRCRPRRTT